MKTKSNFNRIEFLSIAMWGMFEREGKYVVLLGSNFEYQSKYIEYLLTNMRSDLINMVRVNEKSIELIVIPKKNYTVSEIAFAVFSKLFKEDVLSSESIKEIKNQFAPHVDMTKFDINKYLAAPKVAGATSQMIAKF